MRLLFLDVDGVLNKTEYGGGGLNEDCLHQLYRIIKETNCKVVVSSQWRKEEDNLNLLKSFLPDETYIGKTPVIDITERAKEIKLFLFDEFQGALDSYVIIDDWAENIGTSFGFRYVQTNPKMGLTKEKADQAIKVLKTDIILND